MQLEYSNLPDLLLLDDTDPHGTMNYNLEDFFSTDVPTPSSPPRMNFHLYEDPLTMSNMDWSDFDTSMLDNVAKEGESGKEVQIKKEPGTQSEESIQPTESSEQSSS